MQSCFKSWMFVVSAVIQLKHNQVIKSQMDKSSVDVWFLSSLSIFSPTAHLGPPLISHWGPSFQSLLQRLAVPSRAWRTAMAHSNHSNQGDLEAQALRWDQKHRGVPSLHHGRQYRKLGDQVYLYRKITEQKSLWFARTNEKLLNWSFNQIRKFGVKISFCFRTYKTELSHLI